MAHPATSRTLTGNSELSVSLASRPQSSVKAAMLTTIKHAIRSFPPFHTPMPSVVNRHLGWLNLLLGRETPPPRADGGPFQDLRLRLQGRLVCARSSETSVLSVFLSGEAAGWHRGRWFRLSCSAGFVQVRVSGAERGLVQEVSACFVMRSVELVSDAQVDRREVLVLKTLRTSSAVCHAGRLSIAELVYVSAPVCVRERPIDLARASAISGLELSLWPWRAAEPPAPWTAPAGNNGRISHHECGTEKL